MNDDGRFSRERLAGYTPEILARRLLVVGAGALGEAIALQLSMWGFARATVVDFDAYEPSNATRVLDFPHAAVRAGAIVRKSEHVVARWADRLEASATAAADVRAVVGYAQELAPAEWLEADVVLGAVDHPRARFDVAMLARRYDQPLLMGGFDALSRGITVEAFPATRAAACARCSLSAVPTYAATETSCTAVGKRELEARRVPATPTLAAACASLMVQRLVDGLVAGFGDHATLTQLALAGAPGSALGAHARVERDPGCEEHEQLPAIEVSTEGDTLGSFLGALDRASPGASLVLQGGFPLHVVADDADVLVRLATPAWRCPRAIRADAHPRAPEGATSVVLEEIDLSLAERHGLAGVPAAVLGLGPGARGIAIDHGGTRRGVRWVERA